MTGPSLDLDALREAVAWFATQRHPTQGGYDINDPKAWRLERFHNTGVW